MGTVLTLIGAALVFAQRYGGNRIGLGISCGIMMLGFALTWRQLKKELKNGVDNNG